MSGNFPTSSFTGPPRNSFFFWASAALLKICSLSATHLKRQDCSKGWVTQNLSCKGDVSNSFSCKNSSITWAFFKIVKRCLVSDLQNGALLFFFISSSKHHGEKLAKSISMLDFQKIPTVTKLVQNFQNGRGNFLVPVKNFSDD